MVVAVADTADCRMAVAVAVHSRVVDRHKDCLAMELGEPVMFHNPTKKAARYVVVVAREFGRTVS